MSNIIWKDGKAFHKDGYEIKTAEPEDFSDVCIEWQVGDQFDSAGDGHCYFHHLDGIDEDGIEYVGIGCVVDGELGEVTDIGCIEKED